MSFWHLRVLFLEVFNTLDQVRFSFTVTLNTGSNLDLEIASLAQALNMSAVCELVCVCVCVCVCAYTCTDVGAEHQGLTCLSLANSV